MILMLISMSTRLQIIIDNNELKEIKKVAKTEGKSLSQWVRGLIRDRMAKRKPPQRAHIAARLRAMNLPAPPIEQILKEIETGRR